MIAKQAGDGVAPYTSLDVPRYSADRVFRPAGFYGLCELSLPDVSQDTLYVGLDLPVKRRPLERLDGFEAREFLQKWVERSLVYFKAAHGMEYKRGDAREHFEIGRREISNPKSEIQIGRVQSEISKFRI